MMMLSEVASALNARMVGDDVFVSSVGTDSRRIVDEQLFVGIKGEHFDGNQYAAEAIKLGASSALISDEQCEASPAVVVSDTRLALGDLAHYWREKFSMPLIAVTGSNGKTTVKEMIAAILAINEGDVLATEGNLNNDIGMPLSLLKIRDTHRYAVIEMGMNHRGEIRYLTNIAKPVVAVVNNAGTAHIGELGSRQAIAEAKGEIFEGLSADGVAIVNADDDFSGYWKSLNQDRKIVTFGLNKEADVSADVDTDNASIIHLKTPTGVVDVRLNVLGTHNVSNALAASAVAVALGVPNAQIASGLSAFNSVQGRLNQLVGLNGSIVIDDTYNANPDSMKAAIDVLVKMVGKSKTAIFVMGDMAELGSDAADLHADIGRYAQEKGVAGFFALGELSRLATAAFGEQGQHFDAVEALIDALKPMLNQDACVLVKGSRYMRMERVVKTITITDQRAGE